MNAPNRPGPDDTYPSSAADSLIDRLVEEIAARDQAGEAIELEALIGNHPGLADRLARLLPALLILAREGPSLDRTRTGGADEEASGLATFWQPMSSGMTDDFAAQTTKLSPEHRVILLNKTESEEETESFVKTSSPELPPRIGRPTRLQLFGQIARGGMGAIHKGRDPDLGRDVAVKVLLDKHSERSDLICRFIEEAQIGGQLQHPGIVPVYEMGTFADGRPFFAMKLLKGRTLADLLDGRGGSADLPRFLAIFESICQTVAYAHARGVIHRDLKPSNVMVGSFGEVQVMDWGLAKVMHQGSPADLPTPEPDDSGEILVRTARAGSGVSRAGSVIGTPSYMAPEQARGEIESLDERCDVFALGAILCEILTAEPAFTGLSPYAIQIKAARGDLADAFSRLDTPAAEGWAARIVTGPIDPELVSLCKSCLAADPADRPGDAGEVAARVTGYLSGVQERLRKAEIARADQTARAEEATKRARVERHRRRLTVALAAALIGLITLVAGGWISRTHLRAARLAATERVVAGAMAEAHQDLGHAQASPVGDLASWHAAADSALQARVLLDQGEPDPALTARVDDLIALVDREQLEARHRAGEIDRDREFVERLDRIRDRQFEPGGGLNLKRTDADFATAFRDFGIDPDRLDPAEAGRLLKQRSNAPVIAIFLDDWAQIRFDALKDEKSGKPSNDSWRRLVSASVATDPDPWRNKVRSLAGLDDREPARALARDDKELAERTARGLLLLGQILIGQEDNDLAEGVLKRAWRLRPDDFWITLQLARICASPGDRLRYATAAVALRPEMESRLLPGRAEAEDGVNER